MYAEALKKLTDNDDPELRAKILIRCMVVEACTAGILRRFEYSRRTPLVEVSINNALKGKFHLALGGVLMMLGKSEHRPDYTDQAILDIRPQHITLNSVDMTAFVPARKTILASYSILSGAMRSPRAFELCPSVVS